MALPGAGRGKGEHVGWAWGGKGGSQHWLGVIWGRGMCLGRLFWLQLGNRDTSLLCMARAWRNVLPSPPRLGEGSPTQRGCNPWVPAGRGGR